MCIFFILDLWNEKQKATSVLMTSCPGLNETFYMIKGHCVVLKKKLQLFNFNTNNENDPEMFTFFHN